MRALILAALLACGAAPAAESGIEKEVLVPAAPEQVWQAWTTREGIRSFMAPEAIVEPHPGGRFEIHFNPFMPEGQRGADGLRFLALQPGRMLSFEWNAPPSLPEVRAQRTLVIVRLEPGADGGTRVTLSHVGWGTGGQWEQARSYFERAWGHVLGNLRKRFAEQPVDWTPWLPKLREEAERAARSHDG